MVREAWNSVHAVHKPQKAVFWGGFSRKILKILTNIRGSPIGLAGCGIWLFFVVIFGIWAKNRGGKREFQLLAGAGFRVFIGLGRVIGKGNRAGYGISIQHDFIISPEVGENEPFVRIAVIGFNLWIAGPSDGSVPCQVLPSVSIIDRFHVTSPLSKIQN